MSNGVLPARLTSWVTGGGPAESVTVYFAFAPAVQPTPNGRPVNVAVSVPPEVTVCVAGAVIPLPDGGVRVITAWVLFGVPPGKVTVTVTDVLCSLSATGADGVVGVSVAATGDQLTAEDVAVAV